MTRLNQTTAPAEVSLESRKEEIRSDISRGYRVFLEHLTFYELIKERILIDDALKRLQEACRSSTVNTPPYRSEVEPSRRREETPEYQGYSSHSDTS